MPSPVHHALLLDFHGASHVGMLRENNEDAWWAGTFEDEAAGWQSTRHGRLLVETGAWLAVCDGLGGASAGEVASGMAITRTHDALAKLDRGKAAPSRAHEALLVTNDALNQAAIDQPMWLGMGSTISFLWVEQGGALLGQVGDSRMYRLRDKRLKELSPDQSPVGRLRQSGRLTEEEARQHPSRHVIDQCLGGNDEGLLPDCLPLELAADDLYLLCSDGLTDGVTDAEIHDVLAQLADGKRNLAETVDDLIERANRLSGRDNVTILIAAVRSV